MRRAPFIVIEGLDRSGKTAGTALPVSHFLKRKLLQIFYICTYGLT